MKTTSIKKKSPLKKEIKENNFPVVAIGASAGGLEAMMELLKHLPANTGMAFIYVQHLSPDHKSMLTEILSNKTSMIVQEIDDMDKIKPNNVFVIPSNKGIEVTDGHIKLIQRSGSSSPISIDILFTSLAHAQKERVIGIILSGSASDGTVGMRAIKQEGGLTFVQDDTAKFASMPHSAIAAGVVDFILPPKEIALELARLSKHPLIKTIAVKNGEEALIDNRNPDLKIILNHLYKATGVDFNAYKTSTIKRRIIRRMLLYKIELLKDYAKLLSQKKEEIDILYQDLLINVTSFFRDTDTHQYLKEHLFPKLLKSKKKGESIRVWVPACATGEEAYSLAMMWLEIQDSKTPHIPVQIFATDLSEQAISKARIGVYNTQELETVSPKRIQRFFTKANGGFRVNKTVRDMCVFAPHNILHDPPFSRLDFISCCNLFIYLDNAAQKKAVNTFHYALNDGGLLMLGKSENITQSANLFAGFNKKYKIFTRKTNSGTRTLPALLPRYAHQTPPEQNNLVTNKNKTKQTPNAIGAVNHNGLDNAIDAVLISEFMPASVVINHQMEIVQFRGTTDLFLTHPKGKATFNILKMARPEIAFELRNTISKVIKSKHRVRKSGIELKIKSDVRIISLEIVPLKIEWDEPLLLVLFTEQEQTETYSKQSKNGKNNSPAKDRRIKKLEQELANAHTDALAIAQEQEAFTEELQSANEEVVSSNEELQTVNEELETSKEEIESANEELTTTNQELQTRNDLLNESYDFSEAVIATMHNPMVVLDKGLRVKSANKTFYKNFKVNEQETEGVLLYDLGNKQWNIPRLRELLEDILPKNSHFYDFEITHTFPIIGEKIMLLNASRILQKANHEELILLAFADVTEVRRKALELQSKEKEILLMQITAEKNLRKTIEDSEKRYNMMLMQSPFAFAVLKGKDMVIAMANDSIKEMWDKGNEVENKPLLEVLPEIKGKGFMELLDGVYTTGIPYTANEVLVQLKRKGKMEDVYFNFVYQPYREADETISGVTIIAIEVTNEVIAQQKIKDSQQQLQNIFIQAPFALNIYEGKELVISLANKLFCEIIGKTESEILGKKLFDAFPETATQGLDKILSDIFSTGIPFKGNEFPVHFLKHGNEFKGYFDFIYQPIFDYNKNVSGVINVAIDVTDKVLARKKIEESEQRFHNLIYTSPSAIGILLGEDLVITIANEPIIEIWGKGKEIMGKKYFEALPELAEQGYKEVFNQVYKTGIPFNAIETPVNIVQNGVTTLKYYNFILYPQKNINGEINGIGIIATEVTSQAKYNLQIKESEERFRSLVEKAPYPICIFKGKELKLEVANEPMLKIFNVGEEALGKPFLEILPEMKEQPFIALLLDVLENGATHYGSEQPAYFLRKNGEKETYYFNFVYQPYRENDGAVSGVMVLATDVTEQLLARKKIEDSEHEIREIKEQLELSIKTGKIGIWFWDVKKDVLTWNDEQKEIYGFSASEVITSATQFNPLIVPEDLKRIQEDQSAGTKIEHEYDFRIIRKNDGELRWIKSRARNTLDQQGTLQYISGVNIDVTDQVIALNKIQESEERFRNLAETLPQMVWVMNGDGRMEYGSKNWKEYSGIDDVAEAWNYMMHPDDKERLTAYWNQVFAQGKGYRHEVRLKNKEGIYRWFYSVGEPVLDADEKVSKWVGSLTDIHEQKEQKEVLETAVEERTLELSAANGELVKMNKELEAFTYVSSHDLQEPLRKIQTFANRLLEKENTNLSDQGKNYFRLMQSAAQRMQTLIQDLLAFSRLNTADRKFENTDLNKIIQEVKKEFKEDIAEKHATIEVKEICEVHVIPFQFHQLIHNLISNSLKFSNPKIPPHITIESHNKKYDKLNIAISSPQKKYCHISISDNGIGFEKEFNEKIFDVFQRLHGKDAYPGTGIGLAIVKKIVDNHNGIITATGKLNEGATFDIYIPVSGKIS